MKWILRGYCKKITMQALNDFLNIPRGVEFVRRTIHARFFVWARPFYEFSNFQKLDSKSWNQITIFIIRDFANNWNISDVPPQNVL